jgi:hypothetical protein
MIGGQKMNAMGGKLKDQKKNKVTVKTCFHLLLEAMCFQSSKVHINMNVGSAIKKLKRVVR